ncbi:hypothetical protein KJ966_05230 [bacterium]|nr:hypothetical protein [bacterium]
MSLPEFNFITLTEEVLLNLKKLVLLIVAGLALLPITPGLINAKNEPAVEQYEITVYHHDS